MVVMAVTVAGQASSWKAWHLRDLSQLMLEEKKEPNLSLEMEKCNQSSLTLYCVISTSTHPLYISFLSYPTKYNK